MQDHHNRNEVRLSFLESMPELFLEELYSILPEADLFNLAKASQVLRGGLLNFYEDILLRRKFERWFPKDPLPVLLEGESFGGAFKRVFGELFNAFMEAGKHLEAIEFLSDNPILWCSSNLVNRLALYFKQNYFFLRYSEADFECLGPSISIVESDQEEGVIYMKIKEVAMLQLISCVPALILNIPYAFENENFYLKSIELNGEAVGFVLQKILRSSEEVPVENVNQDCSLFFKIMRSSPSFIVLFDPYKEDPYLLEMSYIADLEKRKRRCFELELVFDCSAHIGVLESESKSKNPSRIESIQRLIDLVLTGEHALLKEDYKFFQKKGRFKHLLKKYSGELGCKNVEELVDSILERKWIEEEEFIEEFSVSI